MWEWAWESACPKEWGCRKKAQDLAQSYKINESTNRFENRDFASFKVKFYNCEKRIGRYDSGVEKSAAQNVASQGPVHDCNYNSLTPLGVRARECVRTGTPHWPFFGIFYFTCQLPLSPQIVANVPELVYTSISSYFLLLLSPIQASSAASAIRASNRTMPI